MGLDDIVGLLARLSAFAGMGRGPLMYIAQYAIPRYFEPGEVLFNEGESGEAAYLVIFGDAVAVSESGISHEYTQGDLMAELAMFTTVNHGSTCVARNRLTVLEIPRKLMHGLLQQDPYALDYTRNRIARRIDDIRSSLQLIRDSLEVYAVPGEARVEMAENAHDAGVEAYAAADDGEAYEHDGLGQDADAAYYRNGQDEAEEATYYRNGSGEAGPAPGSEEHLPPEYAQVLNVLGPVTPDQDENGQAPEYDQTELPSLWPHRPVAA